MATGQPQPASPATGATRVDLGFDMGVPGLVVSLPIELTAPDGIRVGTTINDVSFRTSLFTFKEAKVGQGVEADVMAAVTTDAKNPDNTTLRVTVTARKGLALPNGIIATVTFGVAEKADLAETVTLTNVARALSAADPPAPIEPVAGKDGEIEVLGTPLAAAPCFFYMH